MIDNSSVKHEAAAVTHNDWTLKCSIITLPVSPECHSGQTVHEADPAHPSLQPTGRPTLLKTLGTNVLAIVTYLLPTQESVLLPPNTKVPGP